MSPFIFLECYNNNDSIDNHDDRKRAPFSPFVGGRGKLLNPKGAGNQEIFSPNKHQEFEPNQEFGLHFLGLHTVQSTMLVVVVNT